MKYTKFEYVGIYPQRCLMEGFIGDVVQGEVVAVGHNSAKDLDEQPEFWKRVDEVKISNDEKAIAPDIK